MTTKKTTKGKKPVARAKKPVRKAAPKQARRRTAAPKKTPVKVVPEEKLAARPDSEVVQEGAAVALVGDDVKLRLSTDQYEAHGITGVIGAPVPGRFGKTTIAFKDAEAAKKFFYRNFHLDDVPGNVDPDTVKEIVGVAKDSRDRINWAGEEVDNLAADTLGTTPGAPDEAELDDAAAEATVDDGEPTETAVADEASAEAAAEGK